MKKAHHVEVKSHVLTWVSLVMLWCIYFICVYKNLEVKCVNNQIHFCFILCLSFSNLTVLKYIEFNVKIEHYSQPCEFNDFYKLVGSLSNSGIKNSGTEKYMVSFWGQILGARPKWTIYRHESSKNKKYLSGIHFVCYYLKYCIFTKLSHPMYLINIQNLVCQYARFDCKLWKILWFYYAFWEFSYILLHVWNLLNLSNFYIFCIKIKNKSFVIIYGYVSLVSRDERQKKIVNQFLSATVSLIKKIISASLKHHYYIVFLCNFQCNKSVSPVPPIICFRSTMEAEYDSHKL